MKVDELSDWAKCESQVAVHLLGFLNQKPPQNFFYILRWDSQIHSTKALFNVGITNSVVDRMRQHKSSFPGWRFQVVIECHMADYVESFWKAYFEPQRMDISNTEVFLLDHEQETFLVTATPQFAIDGANVPTKSSIQSLREMTPGARLGYVFGLEQY